MLIAEGATIAPGRCTMNETGGRHGLLPKFFGIGVDEKA